MIVKDGIRSRQTVEAEPDLLGEVYEQHFAIVAADTPELLDHAYRLRYQVYCVEHPFLDPAHNPGEREVDEFDAHSVHSLLIHRASSAICGTLRFILPDQTHAPSSFPFAAVSPAAAAMIDRLPRFSTAEISRFAVSKSFRRRVGDTLYPDVGEAPAPPAGMAERRLMPHITYGLVRATLLMSIKHDVTHLCAVMEPALMRLLARHGMHFEAVGGMVDYHGLRQPCFAALDKLVAGVRAVRNDVWRASTEGGRLSAPVRLEHQYG